jgi:hypothetical protein
MVNGLADDYHYEDKVRVLEEITARGLKASDLVGEPPDPNAANQRWGLSCWRSHYLVWRDQLRSV